jgi:hypothetical protein
MSWQQYVIHNGKSPDRINNYHLKKHIGLCGFLYGTVANGVVGIATGYGLDDRGVVVRVAVGLRIFSTSYRPALGSTQPPIQWVPGCEADLPPASAEVKKMWIYTSTPPYAFMA